MKMQDSYVVTGKACTDNVACAYTYGFEKINDDYLDGVVFSADESYLTLGFQTGTPGPVSDYTGQQIYYRSIQHPDGEKHDRLTIHDYLWRWDTDWFWCSRAFGAQNPRLRRLWPRRYRRSSFYWKLIAYDQRFNIADRKAEVGIARDHLLQIPIGVRRPACAAFDDPIEPMPAGPAWIDHRIQLAGAQSLNQL